MNTPNSIKNNSHIILFDGLCKLCSGFMQFIYKRDKEAAFKFAWLQDDKSKEILDWLELPGENFDTIVYIESGRAFFKSTAFLKIVRNLSFPWPILSVGYILPWFLRDMVYDFVAKNRYRWFGKKEACLVPTGKLLKRFSLRGPTF